MSDNWAINRLRMILPDERHHEKQRAHICTKAYKSVHESKATREQCLHPSSRVQGWLWTLCMLREPTSGNTVSKASPSITSAFGAAACTSKCCMRPRLAELCTKHKKY